MILRTNDDPEANGRQAQHGEQRWTLTMILESGETLKIQMGKKTRDNLFGMMIAEEVEDAAEAK